MSWYMGRGGEMTVKPDMYLGPKRDPHIKIIIVNYIWKQVMELFGSK